MVISIFRSRLCPEHAEEFQALADDMLELAREMPGFVSYRLYTAEDGERCSVVEFASAEQLQAWREHPRHRQAQELGRERFYESYSLCVADPLRESSFRR